MARRRLPVFSFRLPFTNRVYAFGQALPPQYDELGSPGALTGGRGPGAPLLNGQLGEEDYCPEWTADRRYDLINKMRLTDDDLRAVFNAITLPIERAPFEVVPAKDAPPDDQVIADFVWHELTHLRDMTWSNFLHQALLAPAFGNMIFEKVWRLRADGRVHLHALAPRMPGTFDQYNVDDNGTLVSVQQQTFGSRRGSALVTLPREKLLLLVHDQEGASFRGRSIFRAAYRSWFMQQNLEVIANVAAERRSMGVDDLLLKGPTVPDRQDKAERAVRLLHAGQKGFFAHGEDIELTVKGVQGSTYDIVPLIELYRKRKITGMGAPMLLLGQGGTGSYALSRDKTDLFMLGIEAIADALVDAINQDVVEPLCQYNFGVRPDDQPYPRLQYQKLDTRQAMETITALSAATGAGLLTPTLDTENEIRRLAEIDELTERDEPARAAHRAATQAPGFGPGKPGVTAVTTVPGSAKAADEALNGAQQTGLLETVRAVAAGDIPRDAGVAIVKRSLQSDDGTADEIIGSAGRGFTPTAQPSTVAAARGREPAAHGAGGCTHLAKRQPGERWKAARAPKGPEVFCNFQRMADALDASGDAIVATATAALADVARGLIAEGKRVFASGDLEHLDALEVPDGAAEALGKAIAAEQRKLYEQGRREVKDETAAQVQTGATVADLKPEDGVRPLAVSLARAREIKLALDTPLDAGDVAKIDKLLAVKGRTVARSMIERVRAELIKRMLQQAERGEFDAQDLLEYHESLSDRQLRQDAKILTTTALGLGRKAEHADLVEQAASAYYSTMLDEDVCCVCAALEDREVRPDSEEYHALYPPRASGRFSDCCDTRDGTYDAPPEESTDFPDCCGDTRCRCDLILRIGESTART